MMGEDELSVQLMTAVQAVHCKVTLAGEDLEPDGLYEATWRGARHVWPQEADWVETDEMTFGL